MSTSIIVDAAGMQTMISIRILPVLQMLIFALLMLIVPKLQSLTAFAVPARAVVAVCIAACGLILVFSGGALFRKHQTTVNPHSPDTASRLVVSGVYRYTRNPMYLGFLLMLCAWCIFLGNLLNFLLLPLFVYTLWILNIRPEEQALSKKFGVQYTAYRRRVRRWL